MSSNQEFQKNTFVSLFLLLSLILLNLFYSQISSSLVNEKIKDIQGSSFHALVLTNSGKVYYRGSVDDNSIYNVTGFDKRAEYTQIPPHFFNYERVSKISVGAGFSSVVTQEGKVFSFGKNPYGNLGLGQNAEERIHFPTQIPPVSFENEQVIDVCCGKFHTLFLTSQNSVYMSGVAEYSDDVEGQVNNNVPKKINSTYYENKSIKFIECGRSASMTITNEGSVYVWGLNNQYHLGLNHSNPVLTPTRIPQEYFNNQKVLQVKVGQRHTLFLTEGGILYGTGSNINSQLGINSSVSESNLTFVSSSFGGANITSIYNLYDSSAALTEDNRLYVWGANYNGNLGFDGIPKIQIPAPIPSSNFDNQTIKYLPKGNPITYVLTESGRVYGMGPNKTGLLSAVVTDQVSFSTPVLLICEAGRLGTDSKCSTPVCFGIVSNNNNVCSSRGNCTAPNQCVCAKDYAGNNCEEFKCYGISSKDPKVCSSRGTCSSINTCNCSEGYSERDCSDVKCYIKGKPTVARIQNLIGYEILFGLPEDQLKVNISSIEWNTNSTEYSFNNPKASLKNWLKKDFTKQSDFFSIEASLKTLGGKDVKCSTTHTMLTRSERLFISLQNVNTTIPLSISKQTNLVVSAQGSRDLDIVSAPLQYEFSCKINNNEETCPEIFSSFQRTTKELFTVEFDYSMFEGDENKLYEIEMYTTSSMISPILVATTYFYLNFTKSPFEIPSISIAPLQKKTFQRGNVIEIESVVSRNTEYNSSMYSIVWKETLHGLILNEESTYFSSFRKSSLVIKERALGYIEYAEFEVKIFLKNHPTKFSSASVLVELFRESWVHAVVVVNEINETVSMKLSNENSDTISYEYVIFMNVQDANLKRRYFIGRTGESTYTTSFPFEVIENDSCLIDFEIRLIDLSINEIVSVETFSYDENEYRICLKRRTGKSEIQIEKGITKIKESIQKNNIEEGVKQLFIVCVAVENIGKEPNVTRDVLIEKILGLISIINSKNVLQFYKEETHQIISSISLISSNNTLKNVQKINALTREVTKNSEKLDLSTVRDILKILNEVVSLIVEYQTTSQLDEMKEDFEKTKQLAEQSVIDSSLPGEGIKSIIGKKVSISYGIVFGSQIQNEMYVLNKKDEGIKFKLPSTLIQETKIRESDVVRISSTIVAHNPFNSTTSKSDNFFTVSLSLTDREKKKIQVKNLQREKIIIEIPLVREIEPEILSRLLLNNTIHLNQTNKPNETYYYPQCVYWNEEISEWRGDGCALKYITSTKVVCECDHLTSFSVFLDKVIPSYNRLDFEDLLLKEIDEDNIIVVLFILCFMTSYIVLMICTFGIDEISKFKKRITNEEKYEPKVEEFGIFRSSWQKFKSGYLFLSLCLRPKSEKNFTRPQRVTVLYVQVSASFVASCIFYGQSQSNPVQTLSAVIVSAIISTPISIVVLEIFKQIDDERWFCWSKSKKVPQADTDSEESLGTHSSFEIPRKLSDVPMIKEVPLHMKKNVNGPKDKRQPTTLPENMDSSKTDKNRKISDIKNIEGVPRIRYNSLLLESRISVRHQRKTKLPKKEETKMTKVEELFIKYESLLDYIDNHVDKLALKLLKKLPINKQKEMYFLGIAMVLFLTLAYFLGVLLSVVLLQRFIEYWDLSFSYFIVGFSIIVYHLFVSATLIVSGKRKTSSTLLFGEKVSLEVFVFSFVSLVVPLVGLIVHIILPFTEFMPWKEFEACFLIAYCTIAVLFIFVLISIVYSIISPIKKMFEIVYSNEKKASEKKIDEKKKTDEQETKGKLLPKVMLLVMYPVSWIIIAICIYFMLVYGLIFRNEIAMRWFTTSLLTFVVSVFVKQPLMAIFKISAIGLFVSSLDLIL